MARTSSERGGGRSAGGSSSSAGRGDRSVDHRTDEAVAAGPTDHRTDEVVAASLADHPIVGAVDASPAGLEDISAIDTGSVQGVRGPNTTEQMPPHPSQRTVIYLIGSKFVDPSVGRRIMTILRGMFNGPWATWRDVDPASCSLLWERFQGMYQWDPTIDGEVRRAWEFVMKKRYPNMMREARRDSGRRAQSAGVAYDGNDHSMLRPYSPTWIREEFWHQMVDNVWNTDGFRARSRAARINRNTLPDGVVSKHTGGSLSTSQHMLQMEKEMGRPPTALKIFERTHLRKRSAEASGSSEGSGTGEATGKGSGTGTAEASRSVVREFVTPRAAHVTDLYQQTMVERYGQDLQTHPHFDADLWEHAAGGRKKGRLFGFGAQPDIVITGSPCSSSTGRSHAGSTSDERVQQLQETLKKLQEDWIAEQAEWERRDAERDAQIQQLDAKLKAFKDYMLSRFPLPPPPPS